MKTLPATTELIDRIYKENISKIDWGDWFEYEPYINTYHLLKSDTKASVIVRYQGNDYFKLVNNKQTIQGIKSQDIEQLCLMDALTDDSIKIIVASGCAGSGKTLISMAYGLDVALTSKLDMTLLCCKPTETVKQSKFFGAVPGTIDEKYQPFLESFMIAAKKVFPDNDYLGTLSRRGKIKFQPIEFVRGNTYDNTVLILDEAQNLEWHSTKTLLTRMGENSKAILLGDVSQKDVKQNDKSGFELLRNSVSFKESSLAVSIDLLNNYRGPISRLVDEIDKEIGY